ncbi:hypothetical protein PQR37_34150 [Paraburkholderia nemoris]|uniref:hypothetical protein n=1 Tax=Paraburkholderia nemoris TaxID=2793076 RepID=UPI0038BB0A62
MSTTIPLTLIEGSMALPCVSSFGRLLPPPFGRDWALLPPVRSLRAELKALYAAMLRTFCISEQAIHSFCKWEPLREWAPATAATATVFGVSVDEAAQTSAEAAAFAPVSAPAEAAPRGTSKHWGALAGGACALGGAAMLAWIAFGHLTQRHSNSELKTAGKVPVRQEAQLANRHSFDAAVTPDATANNRASALAPSAVKIVKPSTATPARAPADNTVSRYRDKQRKGAVTSHERSGRSSQPTIATQSSRQLSHIEPSNYEVPQFAALANAQRTSAKPSSAGPYSPLAPSRLGTDEYAAMTLSAGTHLRKIAPPSRPASSTNPSEVNGTEWINHMSQRRVTEVPDQFTK